MVRIKRFCSTFIFCLILCATPSLLQAAPPYAQVLSKAAHEAANAGTPSEPMQAQGSAIVPSTGKEYVLGSGDRIRLTVYGETDLSGEYEVGSTGVVALPLIGDVPVANQSISTFEQAVRDKLTQGYLRDPRVSAQVVNYRPFFILGEVSKPGSYPYVNGMTVINAIALAGGYTYRADKGGVTISHATDTEKKDISAAEEAVVMPGDIIRVPERFF